MKIFAKPGAGDEVVILLHGLSRTPRSLRVMQEALMQAGYGVMNHGYASTRAPMADLVAGIGRRVAACGARRVHFVTHSLGEVRNLCTAGAMIDAGKLQYFPDIEDAIALHIENMERLGK